MSISTLTMSESARWSAIMDKIAEAFRLRSKEKERISNHVLIRMFGLLPTFANCSNPIGTGFLNVSTYLAERRGGREFFLHHPINDEDPLSRLKPFSDIMADGDQTIVRKGLALASLVMLKDYEADMKSDRQIDKYNPINSDAWDFGRTRKKLIAMVETSPGGRLDAVFSLSSISLAWWDQG